MGRHMMKGKGYTCLKEGNMAADVLKVFWLKGDSNGYFRGSSWMRLLFGSFYLELGIAVQSSRFFALATYIGRYSTGRLDDLGEVEGIVDSRENFTYIYKT